MKYKAVVAILDGQPDLSGDILTNNVRMPENNIPVTLNFEKPPIGIATVKMEDNKIVAEIDIYDINVTSELVETFSGVVGGSILERSGAFIDRWNLTEIGLTTTPCDIRLPKLKKIEE